MYLERKEDLSIFYFLQGLFTDTPYIKIVDSFPEEDLVLPTISVDATAIDLLDFELGNRDGRRLRKWNIDIFANTKSQRDEIGYKILNELKNGIIVYNYDEGFPPSVTPSQESHMDVISRRMTIMKVFPEFTEKMYYRATIEVVATNDVI